MSNALQQNEAKRDLRSLIQSDATKAQLALVLPKHITADRMARVACTAILKTPKLMDCKPESLLQALMLCSQAGLEPDGRNAHLIPFGDQVQVIFDYKGLVALAERNGVECIYADKVCEMDVFDYQVVDGEKKLSHRVDWKKPRGNAYAYYASCRRNGRLDIEVMTRDEVDAIRKRSRAGSSGPWVTDYDEMAKKSVLRRMSKRWDLSSEVAEVINDDADSPEFRGQMAQVFTSPIPAASLLTPPPKAEPKPKPATTEPPVVTTPPEPEPSQREKLKYNLESAGVPFDDFRDFVRVKGIVKETDSWADFAEVPEPVIAALTDKLVAECVKKFGVAGKAA